MHWLAYACWPIAVVHGLGSGSDTRLPGAMLVFVVCIGIGRWQPWPGAWPSGGPARRGWRLGGALAGGAVLLVITAFAVAGPLRPGWSHRAGTSPALLAQLSGCDQHHRSSTPRATGPSSPSTLRAGPGRLGIPAAPFTTSVSGTVTPSSPDANGESLVTLTMKLADTSAPLRSEIIGPAVERRRRHAP